MVPSTVRGRGFTVGPGDLYPGSIILLYFGWVGSGMNVRVVRELAALSHMGVNYEDFLVYAARWRRDLWR